jgi:hypothetical protein
LNHKFPRHGILRDSVSPETALTEYVKKFTAKLLEPGMRSGIERVPELLSFLYRWAEIAGREAPQERTRERTQSVGKFLPIINGLRGWMASEKIYYPLNRRDSERFMDCDGVIRRLRVIAEDGAGSLDDRGKAKDLLEAAAIGEQP